MPTAADIIWDLKQRYYCLHENQDVQAHNVNNRAVREKIQSYLDSKGFPAANAPDEYPFYSPLLSAIILSSNNVTSRRRFILTRYR